jgi:hypothetical protein
MKIDYKTIGKKIWCGALAEMLVLKERLLPKNAG